MVSFLFLRKFVNKEVIYTYLKWFYSRMAVKKLPLKGVHPRRPQALTNKLRGFPEAKKRFNEALSAT